MGFRPSESRRLDVSDLKVGQESDLSDAYIALPGRKSKVGKGRMLQLSDALRAWLRDPAVESAFGRLEDRFGAEPLFINPDARKMPGRRWGDRAEFKTVSRACEKAGVEHIAPNDLGRHAFATQVVADRGDMYSLKDFMGHSDIKTTERYTHVTPQQMGKLHRLHGTKSGPGLIWHPVSS
jgi:site-specific recombinase XerD